MNKIPTVAVLLASFNGAQWLEEQLRSILACNGVSVQIFLSDDGSTDNTVELAQEICGDRLTVLPFEPRGSAGQNFIRMIMDAEWDGCDYVCLADQDDIWNVDKLARAVAVLRETGAEAYSSDVTAFWPDGRQKYIRKSQPQRRWDHLFESAGPGNTFVWPLSQAKFLRDFLRGANPDIRGRIALHDWAVYAIFREAGKAWHIDARSGLAYRQHGENVLGAARGGRAIRARLDLLGNGWYRRQVLCVAALVGAQNPMIDYMRAPRLGRALGAILRAHQCRRKTSDAGALALVFCLMAFSKEQS